jgi:hypothetical protein
MNAEAIMSARDMMEMMATEAIMSLHWSHEAVSSEGLRKEIGRFWTWGSLALFMLLKAS